MNVIWHFRCRGAAIARERSPLSATSRPDALVLRFARRRRALSVSACRRHPLRVPRARDRGRGQTGNRCEACAAPATVSERRSRSLEPPARATRHWAFEPGKAARVESREPVYRPDRTPGGRAAGCRARVSTVEAFARAPAAVLIAPSRRPCSFMARGGRAERGPSHVIQTSSDRRGCRPRLAARLPPTFPLRAASPVVVTATRFEERVAATGRST